MVSRTDGGLLRGKNPFGGGDNGGASYCGGAIWPDIVNGGAQDGRLKRFEVRYTAFVVQVVMEDS